MATREHCAALTFTCPLPSDSPAMPLRQYLASRTTGFFSLLAIQPWLQGEHPEGVAASLSSEINLAGC